MRRALLALVLLVTVLGWSTTVVPMSVEHLTAQSTHVVHARAVNHQSSWNAEHDRIYTYTRFQVLESYKGAAPAMVTVQQLGGHADGYTMKVAGLRSWQNGEEAILFLQPGSSTAFTVTGLMQGDFRVAHLASGETIVSNGVPDATELKANGEIQQYRGAKMSLTELQQRIRRAETR